MIKYYVYDNVTGGQFKVFPPLETAEDYVLESYSKYCYNNKDLNPVEYSIEMRKACNALEEDGEIANFMGILPMDFD